MQHPMPSNWTILVKPAEHGIRACPGCQMGIQRLCLMQAVKGAGRLAGGQAAASGIELTNNLTAGGNRWPAA